MFTELNFYATFSEADVARREAGVTNMDWSVRYVSVRSAFEGMRSHRVNDRVRWDAIPESWRSELRRAMLRCRV
jgi:hypothetical protein